MFAHPVGDQSFIFDILEYASDIQDTDAARFHFEDLLKTFGDGNSKAVILECRLLENAVEE